MDLYNIKSLENNKRKILIDKFNNLYVLDKNGLHTLLKQKQISSQFFDMSKLNIDFSKYNNKNETIDIIDNSSFSIYQVIDIIKELTHNKFYNYNKKQLNSILDNKLGINELKITIKSILQKKIINKDQTTEILNTYADNAILNKTLNKFIYNINQIDELLSGYISLDNEQIQKTIKNLICIYTKQQINKMLQNYVCQGDIIQIIQNLSLLKNQFNNKLQLKLSKDDIRKQINNMQNIYTKLQFNTLLQKKLTLNILKQFLYLKFYTKQIINNLLLPKLTLKQVINAIYYITYKPEKIQKMFNFLENNQQIKNMKIYLLNIANNYTKQQFNIKLDQLISKQEFKQILKNYTYTKEQINFKI